MNPNRFPFLLPWVRAALLIRSILATTWDDATWPQTKEALRWALTKRLELARRPEWLDLPELSGILLIADSARLP